MVISAQYFYKKLKNFNITLAGILLLGLALRLILINRFCIAGDEWYTIYSAEKLGVSIMAYPYFFLIKILLHFFSINPFILRLFSIIVGMLGIIPLYKVGSILNQEKIGQWAALLTAISPFQIMAHLEIRYYGLYFLMSALALFFVLRFIRKPKANHFFYLYGALLFAVWMHFNMVFFCAGFAMYLFLIKFMKIKNGQRFILSAALLAFLVLVIMIRSKIFFLVARFGFSDAPVTLGGMIGWGKAAFIKPFFTLFCFAFGFNANPLQIVLVVPFGLLILWVVIKGFWNSNKYLDHPRLFWTCFLIFPILLLFFVVEPLSTGRFAGILSPKHVMFAYPPYMFALSLGVESFKKRVLKSGVLTALIVLNLIGYASLFRPAYSYYAANYIDLKKPRELMKNLDLSQMTLFIVDPRTKKSFEFYNKSYLEHQSVLNPWEFLELNKNKKLQYGQIIFASDNWKELINDKKSAYARMFKEINQYYQLIDGFTDYPFFFYIFKTKSENKLGPAISYEPYGFHYADLHLPIMVGASKIFGSFALDKKTSQIVLHLPKDRVNQKLTIIYNLEDSESLPDGSEIGSIDFLKENKESVPLKKNINTFDVFYELKGPRKDILSHIAYTWEKEPLMSSSQSFYGAHRRIHAHLYKLELNLGPEVRELAIRYHTGIGKIRIWGIY